MRLLPELIWQEVLRLTSRGGFALVRGDWGTLKISISTKDSLS